MRVIKSAKLRRRDEKTWALTFSFRDEGPETAFAIEHGALGGMFTGFKGSVAARARKDQKTARFEREILYAMLCEKTGMSLTGLRQVVLSRMEDKRHVDREDHGPRGDHRQAA